MLLSPSKFLSIKSQGAFLWHLSKSSPMPLNFFPFLFIFLIMYFHTRAGHIIEEGYFMVFNHTPSFHFQFSILPILFYILSWPHSIFLLPISPTAYTQQKSDDSSHQDFWLFATFVSGSHYPSILKQSEGGHSLLPAAWKATPPGLEKSAGRYPPFTHMQQQQ